MARFIIQMNPGMSPNSTVLTMLGGTHTHTQKEEKKKKKKGDLSGYGYHLCACLCTCIYMLFTWKNIALPSSLQKLVTGYPLCPRQGMSSRAALQFGQAFSAKTDRETFEKHLFKVRVQSESEWSTRAIGQVLH